MIKVIMLLAVVNVILVVYAIFLFRKNPEPKEEKESETWRRTMH